MSAERLVGRQAAEPGFVTALDFGGSKTAIATAALGGRLLQRRRLEVPAGLAGEEVLDQALRTARQLSEEAAADGGRCLAVGVSSPGVVTASGVLLSPNLKGWERLRLAELLQRFGDRLGGAAVAIGNDVKCAALAELRWGELAGADPGVYLNLGTGVGAALTVGGEVVEGAHGAAGEIGYAPALQPSGEPPATLEGRVGARALAERASLLLGRPAGADELFGSGAAQSEAVLASAFDALAASLSTLVLAVDPERVVLGGGLMGHGDHVLEALRGRLRSPEPIRPQLRRARFGTDASLHGAVALALAAAEASALVPAGEDRR